VLSVALTGCAAVIISFFIWFISRPRISIRLEGGRAHIHRGQLPPGLLSDLNDLARRMGKGQGEIQIRGIGSTLQLTVKGLDEGPTQQVRNVILLRRDRI